ncbi:hypothetical protein [Paenibacillus sacheonensis]|uniref:Uncharacterized protein n=1 Tax=Paenibacillus sacheonensis TaxID=742054 RepID=A0A7X5BZM1_9BACL|nr:hypothetical protein [Paenibacillus sacheonensis]MBM7563092.1 hypothetical protein [Paenibacillus sacheonensis]NBC68340.1 hypothetical protein [Paenibacillus sacheonensis]
MRPKLVLIEGLPGSGKTTTARLVHEILAEMNVAAQLFEEGNLDHPADYDGVAVFTNEEWHALLTGHEAFKEVLARRVVNDVNHYFLEYRKMFNEHGFHFPDELVHAIFKHDVYELPLGQNRKQITERWKTFAESASQGSETYIFECCFIQNPVTMGMIKFGAPSEDVIGYVAELAAIVERLNPVLIYVDQDDLDYSFRKAVDERPAEWSTGFIDYYTLQGYGQAQGYTGLEGTVEVLKARSELEDTIFNDINIAKIRVINSLNDRQAYKQVLVELLAEYFK